MKDREEEYEYQYECEALMVEDQDLQFQPDVTLALDEERQCSLSWAGLT